MSKKEFDTSLAIVIISEKCPAWYVFNIIKKPKKKNFRNIFRFFRK